MGLFDHRTPGSNSPDGHSEQDLELKCRRSDDSADGSGRDIHQAHRDFSENANS
jgi:hypothetical protein